MACETSSRPDDYEPGSLLVVLVALLAGWREAAAVGLVVLLVLDLMVLIREQPSMSKDEPEK